MTRHEFVTVQQLSQGFSEYALTPTDAWVGRPLSLYTAQRLNLHIHCLSLESAWVDMIDQNGQRYQFSTAYKMLSIRTEIYFLDFLIPGHVLAQGRSISLTAILNTQQATAFIIWGVLPLYSEYSLSTFYRASQNMPISAVKLEFYPAALNQQWHDGLLKIQATDQLIGRKFKFRYSEQDLYQHSYLNEKFYTWQCLKGIEAGLCETDRCYYFAVADELYLLVWIEKIIPTLGIVIEDLNNLRSHGKICGYAGYDAGQISNFIVGAFAEEVTWY